MLKPGDVRQCGNFWMIVTHIAPSHDSLPQSLIQYNFLLSIEELLKWIKMQLDLPAEADMIQILLAAYISSNVVDDMGLIESLLKNANEIDFTTTFVYVDDAKLKKTIDTYVFELSLMVVFVFADSDYVLVTCLHLCFCYSQL